MSKLSFFSILLFLLTNSFLTANPVYSVSNISDELKENAHTVIRYEKTTFMVTNINKAETRYKAIITILNKNSDAGNIVVPYDKVFNKVELKNIKVYDANGNLVRKLKNKDVTDHSTYSRQMFDDSRYKYANASHSEYPYTIEYEYVRTTTMTMFYPTWYVISDFEVSVEKSDFEIITPLDINARYHLKNIDIPVNKSIEGNQRFYSVSAENIPAMVDESMRPTTDKIIPYIIFAPDKFGLDGNKGDMSSWESFGKFNYNLNAGRDNLSAEMKATVNKLIKDATTKEEKIEILYKYLQENMRYVSIQLGVGGWQTFDAQYVERNKYGDCKALTNFMKSILTEVDIEAYAALIYNGAKNTHISKDFSCAKFNHVVLYVPDKQEGIWLECTSADLPPGVIGSSNENRYALLLKPNGGELISTPVSNQNDNSLQSKINITLTQNGHANINIKQKASGIKERKYRYFAFNESEEETRKIFHNDLPLPSFKINTLELVPSKKTPETEISLDIEVQKYASKSGKRLFICPNSIHKLSYIPHEMPSRLLPIENTYASMIVDTVIIEIPFGYEIENIPQKELIIENDFGSYAIQLKQKENHLIYTRKMEKKAFLLPKERYDEYRQFLKAVVKADKTKVVLVRNQP